MKFSTSPYCKSTNNKNVINIVLPDISKDWREY